MGADYLQTVITVDNAIDRAHELAKHFDDDNWATLRDSLIDLAEKLR